MIPITRARLVEILHAIRNVRMGVIGDFNLDAYWFADMTRSQLSRETPLFPRPVTREAYTPGGAANVSWNAAALQVKGCHALTVIGPDWRGEILLRLLQEANVCCDHILVDHSWQTPLFGKVILLADGLAQEDARLDFVNVRPPDSAVSAALIQKTGALLADLDVLVCANYQAQGIFTPVLIGALNRMASKNPSLWFIADSRDQIGRFAQMVIKPNEVEARGWLSVQSRQAELSLEELKEAGLKQARNSIRPFFITLAERGVLVFTQDRVEHIPGAPVAPPLDPVGAGDTFLASVAAGLAAQATPVEAAALATLSTAVTLKKLHVTGTASPAEIISLYDQLSLSTIPRTRARQRI